MFGCSRDGYSVVCYMIFFFNDTATPEIYTYLHTLALHDALPISPARKGRGFGPPLIHETSKMTGKTRIWFNRGFSLAPIAGLMRAADPTLDVFVSVSQQSVHYTGPTETWIEIGRAHV